MVLRQIFCIVILFLLLPTVTSFPSWLSFLNRQQAPSINSTTTSAPTLSPEQCPCLSQVPNQNCHQYDSRYQAATMEEAIKFFEDMSLIDEKTPAEVVQPKAPAVVAQAKIVVRYVKR